MTNHYTIVTPCYNEEESVIAFLQKLEQVLVTTGKTFSVVVVDDHSLDSTLSLLKSFRFESNSLSLKILSLKFNVGHQEAIFQGLGYALTLDVDKVIVMDSDGEDDPSAIPLILQQDQFDIVEVRRGKRSETLTFRLMYRIYKLIFYLITGKSMNYGNYCMISRPIVERISYTSFIHLPAYLLKLKVKGASVTVDRAPRVHGKSKMGLKGLLIHSFKSFIEFGEDLLLLFLKLFAVIAVVLTFLLTDILYQKFVAHTAILGWTSTLALILLNIAILCIGFFVIGILLLNLAHAQDNGNRKDIFTVIDDKS